MARNISSLSYQREMGFAFGLNTNRKTGRTRERDFAANLIQHRMKDIFCLNSQKYWVPGELEHTIPPYAVEFSTAPGSEDTFAIADEDGVLSLFSSNDQARDGSFLKPLRKLQAHKNAIFDIAWMPQENFLSTACGDQTAALWDVVKGEAVAVFKGHSCSLKSINISKHNTNMLVTGSRDGNALVWDKRTPQSAVRIQDAHVIKDSLTPMRKKRKMPTNNIGQLGIDSRQTVSCALFYDSNTVITSGAMDGTLKIWDIRKIQQPKKNSAKSLKSQPIETLPYPGSSMRRRGYTCLTLDSSNTNLFASCTDDSIYHYNLSLSAQEVSKRRPLCKYQGQYNTSFYVRTALSPGNEFLISGSDDCRAYVWRADGRSSSPILRLVSDEMAEVTAVAWCPYDIRKLVTCSDECVVRIWNLPLSEKTEVKDSDIDGRAEVMQLEQEYYGKKRPGPFTPILVVSKNPQQDMTSPSATPTSDLVMTELFTPQKSSPLNNKSMSAVKAKTPLRSTNSSASRTPNSIEKWITRPSLRKQMPKTNSGSSKSRVVKCLEGHMSETMSGEKENCDGEASESGIITTPQKNWLADIAKRRQSHASTTSPASKRHKSIPSSPVGRNQNDQTPVKQLKTLDAYFSPRSLL